MCAHHMRGHRFQDSGNRRELKGGNGTVRVPPSGGARHGRGEPSTESRLSSRKATPSPRGPQFRLRGRVAPTTRHRGDIRLLAFAPGSPTMHSPMRYDRKTHHRRSVRLASWDYGNAGAYFVTICTFRRECVLDDPRIDRLLRRIWARTVAGGRFPGEGEFVVMPNHVHGIVWIHATPAWLGARGVGANRPRSRDKISLREGLPSRADHPASVDGSPLHRIPTTGLVPRKAVRWALWLRRSRHIPRSRSTICVERRVRRCGSAIITNASSGTRTNCSAFANTFAITRDYGMKIPRIRTTFRKRPGNGGPDRHEGFALVIVRAAIRGWRHRGLPWALRSA